MKRTPLYAAHQKLGAKLIEFGGWEMPVQYSSIVDEHLAVRKAAGLFDISHMGEVFVAGPEAQTFLNRLLTNDIRKLVPGQGQYTLMCNEKGGVIDDLYAYCLRPAEYLLIVNASRIEADLEWLQRHGASIRPERLKVEDRSSQTAAVAVQGPRVVEFIGKCFPGGSHEGTSVAGVTELKKNEIGAFGEKLRPVWISRTGYTGEDGFELVMEAGAAESVWERLLEAGCAHGLKPAGLGARDTLRTEVCYPLYGHELDEHTTPLEAGLGYFVALDKSEFIGSKTLFEQKTGGLKKKLVAFKMAEKSAPPRPHYPILKDGQKLGEVVSGTQSPSLGIGIGLGYVPPASALAGTPLEIEIRGKRAAAKIVPKPFYRKAN